MMAQPLTYLTADEVAKWAKASDPFLTPPTPDSTEGGYANLSCAVPVGLVAPADRVALWHRAQPFAQRSGSIEANGMNAERLAVLAPAVDRMTPAVFSGVITHPVDHSGKSGVLAWLLPAEGEPVAVCFATAMPPLGAKRLDPRDWLYWTTSPTAPVRMLPKGLPLDTPSLIIMPNHANGSLSLIADLAARFMAGATA